MFPRLRIVPGLLQAVQPGVSRLEAKAGLGAATVEGAAADTGRWSHGGRREGRATVGRGSCAPATVPASLVDQTNGIRRIALSQSQEHRRVGRLPATTVLHGAAGALSGSRDRRITPAHLPADSSPVCLRPDPDDRTQLRRSRPSHAESSATRALRPADAGVAYLPGTASHCPADAPTRRQQPWQESIPGPGLPSR